jgi:hypothetical protein
MTTKTTSKSGAARERRAQLDNMLANPAGVLAARQRMYAERAQRDTHGAMDHKTPKRICNASVSKTYDGVELQPYAGRPGAMNAFDLPSRMGRTLHYRDGRVEQA